MASFAATAAARSVFRSSSVRKAAARLGPQARAKAKPAPAPLGLSSRIPLPNRIFRKCPVEASFCVSLSDCFSFDDIDALHFSQQLCLAPGRPKQD